MTSTAYKVRGGRRPLAPGAYRRARRRRFMVRRVVFVLALFLVLLLFFGAPLYSVSFPERMSEGAVLPVEAGTPPALPHPRPPELDRPGPRHRQTLSPTWPQRQTGPWAAGSPLTFDDARSHVPRP